jgi:hypothetical protein
MRKVLDNYKWIKSKNEYNQLDDSVNIRSDAGGNWQHPQVTFLLLKTMS